MKGKGTVLSRYNGTTWDIVTEIYSINGGGRLREDIEDDDLLDAATEVYRKKAPGSKFIQPYSIEIRWDPRIAAQGANQDLLLSDYDSNALSYFRIKYTDAENSGEVFKGYVKELSDVELVPNGTVRRTVVLMPDGSLFVYQEDIDSYVIV